MFKYLICNTADEKIFEKQTKAIIKKFNSSNVEKAPVDVDGSTKTRVYVQDKDYVDIIIDGEIDYVGIESTIDLEKVFAK